MQYDLQPNPQHLDIADKGIRFVHNIVDTIAFYAVLFFQSMLMGGLLGIIPEEDSVWFLLYYLFLYVMFHTLCEHLFGKTPGKFITKTKVVKKDGSKPTFINLLGRNAARFVPFDPLSFLLSERGWHDQLSDTYVVRDAKKS